MSGTCGPVKAAGFENRKGLPVEWCGLRDQVLSDKTGAAPHALHLSSTPLRVTVSKCPSVPVAVCRRRQVSVSVCRLCSGSASPACHIVVVT
eukprot:3504645-Rhodomonas_salina.1